ncbi:unnamed protein product [Cyclocybe aegerita]|uniref:F-box domain-containing protein n=1 Tax=Cyclocybe aegerita TaxID=1973307 RepID=A0A8S0XMU6_CYCAE|nr:unnamed protein product [Cyclocybe aegerita]
MPGLTDLATELFYEISSHLDEHANRTLRLASKKLCAVASSIALSQLKIDCQASLTKTVQKLEAYGTRSTRGADYVSKAVILSLSPKEKTPTLESIARSIHLGLQLTPADKTFLEAKLLTKFTSALFALKDVRSISWHTSATDPSWAFKAIYGYVVARKVPVFHVDFTGGFHLDLTNFDRITCLRCFSFTNLPESKPIYNIRLLRAAAKIIHNSPDLESLEISTAYKEAIADAPTVSHLLRGDLPPLSLKHLSVCRLRFPLDDSILPHFRSLKSLSVHHNFDGARSDIWDTLKDEKIHRHQRQGCQQGVPRLPEVLGSAGTRARQPRQGVGEHVESRPVLFEDPAVPFEIVVLRT